MSLLAAALEAKEYETALAVANESMYFFLQKFFVFFENFLNFFLEKSKNFDKNIS